MATFQEQSLSSALYRKQKTKENNKLTAGEKRSGDSSIQSDNDSKHLRQAAKSFIKGNCFQKCTVHITINAKSDS